MSLVPSLPRTLLVEDDPLLAAQARSALAALGFPADLADCAEDALAKHGKTPYRIVLSNLDADGVDGVDLCRRLRDLPGSSVHVLLYGANDDEKRQMAAYDAGVDDCLGKPLHPAELRARLVVARRLLAAEDRRAEKLLEEETLARETGEMAESLKIASRRFEDLFNGLPVACFTFDTEGCVHEWNQSAEEAFGVPAFDALVRPVWEVLEAGGGAWTPDRCAAALSGSGQDEFEWSHGAPGDAREFVCRVIALRGREGRRMGAVCANVDVTAHKRAERLLADEKASLQIANARLEELASRDGLTALWNRRSFLGDLEGALCEHSRTGKPFSLVLLDIDRFKAYNDSFGHPAGDEVLRRFARVLRTTARSYENPARYGGEEFAIVLHDTGAAKGLAAAERFRRAVADADWIERPVTCSLGVATVGSDGLTAEALIAAADAALYASKDAGRNRATHAAALPVLAQAA